MLPDSAWTHLVLQGGLYPPELGRLVLQLVDNQAPLRSCHHGHRVDLGVAESRDTPEVKSCAFQNKSIPQGRVLHQNIRSIFLES